MSEPADKDAVIAVAEEYKGADVDYEWDHPEEVWIEYSGIHNDLFERLEEMGWTVESLYHSKTRKETDVILTPSK